MSETPDDSNAAQGGTSERTQLLSTLTGMSAAAWLFMLLLLMMVFPRNSVQWGSRNAYLIVGILLGLFSLWVLVGIYSWHSWRLRTRLVDREIESRS